MAKILITTFFIIFIIALTAADYQSDEQMLNSAKYSALGKSDIKISITSEEIKKEKNIGILNISFYVPQIEALRLTESGIDTLAFYFEKKDYNSKNHTIKTIIFNGHLIERGGCWHGICSKYDWKPYLGGSGFRILPRPEFIRWGQTNKISIFYEKSNMTENNETFGKEMEFMVGDFFPKVNVTMSATNLTTDYETTFRYKIKKLSGPNFARVVEISIPLNRSDYVVSDFTVIKEPEATLKYSEKEGRSAKLRYVLVNFTEDEIYGEIKISVKPKNTTKIENKGMLLEVRLITEEPDKKGYFESRVKIEEHKGPEKEKTSHNSDSFLYLMSKTDELLGEQKQKSSKLRMVFVPIGFNDSEYAQVETIAQDALQHFSSASPLKECKNPIGTINSLVIMPSACNITGCTDQCGTARNNENCQLRVKECVKNSFGTDYDLAVGLCKDTSCGGSCGGCADSIPSKSVVVNTAICSGAVAQRMVSHELGHALGLYHIKSEAGVNNCWDDEGGACQGSNKADCDMPALNRSMHIMAYCPSMEDFGEASYGHLKSISMNKYLEVCK